MCRLILRILFELFRKDVIIMVKRVKNNRIMKERTIKTPFDDMDFGFDYLAGEDNRDDFDFIMDELDEILHELKVNLISNKENDMKKICESGDEKAIQGLYDNIKPISRAIHDAAVYVANTKNRLR